MKISQITNAELQNYLRIDGTMSTADTTLLTSALASAKAYMASYIGIPYTVSEETVTDEGVVTVTRVDSKGNVILSVTEDGITTITAHDKNGNVIDVPDNMDNYEDLWLACVVLVQDAYDNRTMYVDSNNVNKAVETVLNMHISADTFLGR